MNRIIDLYLSPVGGLSESKREARMAHAIDCGPCPAYDIIYINTFHHPGI